MNNQIDISSFKHLYPFTSHYLNINELKYHYIDEGSGEPVIMVHGNPTWSFYYRSLIKALSGNYRAIAVDHMGCGLSDKPNPDVYGYRYKNRVDDLEKLIDSLDLKKQVTLVLHDWGGAIGAAWAVKHPEKVGRLVITNTSAFLPPGKKKIPLRLWLIRNISMFAKPAVLGLNIFSRAALFMASSKGLSKEIKTGLTAPYNSWENRMATLKFVQDIPLKPKDPSYDLIKYVDDNLYKLSDIPMLICWGNRDFVFDRDYLAEWKHRFPNADVHAYEDANHYVLEDVPERVIPLVKDFLKNHPVL